MRFGFGSRENLSKISGRMSMGKRKKYPGKKDETYMKFKEAHAHNKRSSVEQAETRWDAWRSRVQAFADSKLVTRSQQNL